MTQGLSAEQQISDNKAARDFVSSKMFSNIFAIGMELVEETAAYLDGEGREAAKELSRAGALTYAGCSMRLTTRLMQIASWLLVLRAMREGEMSFAEAANEKYRLGESETRHPDEQSLSGAENELPGRLLELVEETDNLYGRIARIDADLFTQEPPEQRKFGAASQLQALRDAFAER